MKVEVREIPPPEPSMEFVVTLTEWEAAVLNTLIRSCVCGPDNGPRGFLSRLADDLEWGGVKLIPLMVDYERSSNGHPYLINGAPPRSGVA